MFYNLGENGNLVKWVEQAAKGEEIIGVVIGDKEPYPRGDTPEKREAEERASCFKIKYIPPDKRNIVLSWHEAKEWLDYDFSTEFGATGCHPLTAWTKNKVLFVSEYDGATGLHSLPRNPEPHQACYSGMEEEVE